MKFHQQLTFTQYHSIQIVSVIVKVSCTKKVKEGNSKVNVPKEISSAYSSVMCSAIQVLTRYCYMYVECKVPFPFRRA